MEKHQTDSQSGAVSGEDQKTEAEKKSRKKTIFQDLFRHAQQLLSEKKSRKLDTNKS